MIGIDLIHAARAIEFGGTSAFGDAERLAGPAVAYALVYGHVEKMMRQDTSAQGLVIDRRVDDYLQRMLGEAHAVLGQSPTLFFTHERDVLDNFAATAIAEDGVVYPTVEHYYQAAKFTCDGTDEGSTELLWIVGRVRSAPSPHQAKAIASQHKHRWRYWDEAWKLSIMEHALRLKHAQHEVVRRVLRETGLLLVEDSPDPFWGRGHDWTGQNWMGKLWMKIRDEGK